MKQFKADSVSDEDMYKAVMQARMHFAKTDEPCQAVCFSVLLWDSRSF